MKPSMALNYGPTASLVPDKPILKLSVDYFSIIVEYVEDQDIRSARLAGRDLHFFLSPYLFRSISFPPSQKFLDILEMVSQNEVFSHNVRILRFKSNLFLLTEDEPNDRG
jgi:hypothetical protein